MATQVELLKKYGLSVRGGSGQHLLMDSNIARKIVDLLPLKPKEKVLEIGPGLGALTEEILRRGARLIAVEKDKSFVEILQKEFAAHIGKSLTIIHEDILKTDLNTIFSRHPEGRMTVIGNLPYYITAPILFHLFSHAPKIEKAILTMQKEVAMRLLASPGTKEYGRLTLAARYYADVSHVFDISRACFTPRPEVDSSVVILKFHEVGARRRLASTWSRSHEKLLFHIIQTAFSQRRKTLLPLLARDPKLKMSKQELLSLFEKLQFASSTRGEELLLKDYLALTDALASVGAGLKPAPTQSQPVV